MRRTNATPSSVSHDPVEKIAFDRAVNACARKSLAGQETARIVLGHPQHGEGNAFGDDDEKGCWKP